MTSVRLSVHVENWTRNIVWSEYLDSRPWSTVLGVSSELSIVTGREVDVGA